MDEKKAEPRAKKTSLLSRARMNRPYERIVCSDCHVTGDVLTETCEAIEASVTRQAARRFQKSAFFG